MKKHMFTGLFVSVLSIIHFATQSACAVEPASDLGPQIQIAIPGAGDYDLYESGVGIELQYRNWLNDYWGYLAAVGFAEWQADDNATNPGANLYDFDGNIEFIPVGLSGLFNLFSGDEFSITLEGGFRYIVLDSKITARNSDHSPAERYDVKIDDTVIARIAADFDYVLSDDFILSLGLAYHIDLEPGDLSTELGPARDNVMDAFLAEIALRMPL